MSALHSVPQSGNPAVTLFVIAVIVAAVFWRFLLKVGLCAVIIGFLFLLISASLEIVHLLRALIP